MIFLVLWLIGIISGIAAVVLNPALRTLQSISGSLLFFQMVVTVTLSGLAGFTGHVFRSDAIAESIGWPKGSLFQKELGFSQLGWVFAGILSIWYKGSFQAAVILMICPLFIGAAVIHFMDMRKNKNHNPGNGLIIIFADLLIPVTLIILSILAKIW